MRQLQCTWAEILMRLWKDESSGRVHKKSIESQCKYIDLSHFLVDAHYIHIIAIYPFSNIIPSCVYSNIVYIKLFVELVRHERGLASSANFYLVT